MRIHWVTCLILRGHSLGSWVWSPYGCLLLVLRKLAVGLLHMAVFWKTSDSLRKEERTVSQLRRPRLESSTWRWTQHGPPKRWYRTTTLHGVITQKTSTRIFTAVNSNWRIASATSKNQFLWGKVRRSTKNATSCCIDSQTYCAVGMNSATFLIK